MTKQIDSVIIFAGDKMQLPTTWSKNVLLRVTVKHRNLHDFLTCCSQQVSQPYHALLL